MQSFTLVDIIRQAPCPEIYHEWGMLVRVDFHDFGWLGYALAGGVVSRDISSTLLALANALVILGSWSTYLKNPRGTTARLEPSLASSSMTSLCPHTIWRNSRPTKLFSKFAELLVVHHLIIIQTWPFFVDLVDYKQWVSQNPKLVDDECSKRSLNHEVVLHTRLHC
jgi:hypothetical protein